MTYQKQYVCSRGVQRKASQSMYCGCTAKIEALVERNSAQQDMIQITYHWKHVGHIPTNIKDMRSGPANPIVAAFIQEQIENNMTWYNIKNMLRLDKAIVGAMLNEDAPTSIPLSLNVKYSDVYFAIKKHLEKMARLHSNMVESLKKWEKNIVEDDSFRGYFFQKNLDTFESGMFFVAFMSQWQLKV
jgi:hypothetical protein